MKHQLWFNVAMVLTLTAPSMKTTARDSNKIAVNSVTDSTTHQLEDVVVTGTRNSTDIRKLPYTVNLIDRAKLMQSFRTSILPTLIENIPNLFVTSRGMMGYGVSTNAAGNITLRGISSSNGGLLVLIDGHPQYQGIYGHSISDSYQTMDIERVEVLRGPASLLYGSNAMGGVINIITRNSHHDGNRTTVNVGAGSYGSVQTEISNEYRHKKLSSTVAANYNRTDNNRPDMGFEQYGGYIKLNYDWNRHWNTYLDANITHFNASNPGTVSSPLYDSRQWITRGVVNLALENHYQGTSGAVSLYSNFGRHKINDGSSNVNNPSTRYFRSRDALSGLSLYETIHLFKNNHTTFGFDWQNIYGRAFYTSIATGEVLDTPNKQSGHSHHNEYAGYIDFRQDLASWMTLDAGIRLDHHTLIGSEWIPQGGIVFRPISTGEIKISVSKGFRNPSMREMYLYPPSNTNLNPERLMEYELGWKQHLAERRLTYGINIFYIKGDNMIETMVVGGRPRNVNSGKIENSGAEMEARWLINDHWSLNTNHSVLHMVNHALASPEYKGYLGGTYHNGKWMANAGLMQIAGLFTDLNNNATENYTLFNASVTYHLCKNLQLWARGENLLAQQYEINAGFPMPRITFMGGINVKF